MRVSPSASRRRPSNATRGLVALRRPAIALRGMALTIASWATLGLAYWILLQAFGIELPLAAGMLVTVAINLSLVLPSSPAALGVFEAATIVALAAFDVPQARGAVLCARPAPAQLRPVRAHRRGAARARRAAPPGVVGRALRHHLVDARRARGDDRGAADVVPAGRRRPARHGRDVAAGGRLRRAPTRCPAQDTNTAAIVAVGLALVLTLARIVRRQSPMYALSGLVGVAFAAFVATRSGRAENFFLPGLLANAAYAAAFLISLAVRWPLVGVIVCKLDGEDSSWRQDPPRVRAFVRATWLWAGLFGLRLAVQLPLYAAGAVVALGDREDRDGAAAVRPRAVAQLAARAPPPRAGAGRPRRERAGRLRRRVRPPPREEGAAWRLRAVRRRYGRATSATGPASRRRRAAPSRPPR